MKIGILTYHRAHNYGALLQCYALKEYLKKYNHVVEIIDYWPEYHNESYKLLSLKLFSDYSILGKCKFILIFIFGFSRILKRRKGYINFIYNVLELPKKIRYSNGKDICDHYDVVIYGSDQIWRKQKTLILNGFDEVYFGEYPTNTKLRISYAASMGVIKLLEKDSEYLEKILKNFNEISVREVDLQNVLKYIGYNANIVLDPVFLLNKEDWNTLIDCSKIKLPSKYIFFYHLTFSTDALILIEKLKLFYGYEIIEIRNVVNPLLIGSRYKYQIASPEDFLKLFKNAEFVVSTSFHGTALSIIFEKQFYITGMGNNSERSRTLLKNLEIGNRYLDNIETIDLAEVIDYQQVNIRLVDLQNKSKNFIHNSI